MDQDGTMDLKAFIAHLRAEWYVCLPPGVSSQDYRITIQERGGKLLLSDSVRHLAPMPHLDLREVFERCGRRFDLSILKDIFMEYIKSLAQAAETDKKEQELFAGLLSTFPEKKIISMMVPYARKETKETAFPGRRYGNAYMRYAVLPDGVPPSCGSMRTAAVTDAMMEKWSITEEVLHEAAGKNMPGLFPYDIRELSSVPESEGCIISSESRCFGLPAVLYEEGPLKELSMKTGSDYYVFPLSVHEAAAFPVSGLLKEAELSALAGEVSPYGGEVWYYRKSLNRTAFTREERALQEAVLKNGVLDAADKRRGMDEAFR